MPPKERVLLCLLRRDLRLADNPIFHEVARLHQQSESPFTHLLPIYYFPSNQVETSGFLQSPDRKSPYAEARSQVGGFWRCGALRAKFLAESVWDLKRDLEKVGSGVAVRVGTAHDVLGTVLQAYNERKEEFEITGVYMTNEEGVEEKREERDVRKLCRQYDTNLKIWVDEKYFIDDRDVPFDHPSELSDVFTSFRKTVEPLREAPRGCLKSPTSLPPMPSFVPEQFEPFSVPQELEPAMKCLLAPLNPSLGLAQPPTWPSGAESAHPFEGGSKTGLERVEHLIRSGSMTAYKDTRNGLLGTDFSTKLSAWLALGCITARQVHWYLIDFEDGKTSLGKEAPGYGKGQNKGTAAVRFELLWRDYMRLCTRKFGPQLFRIEGFREDKAARWRYVDSPFTHSSKKGPPGAFEDPTSAAVARFIRGRTGTGLIDASQRELFLTGYTSNRARQNVASYLTKHLGIDWRIGAEWYECNLIDYDVSSNYGNWQYVAGVGNDPRAARIFNPVKQALDYDPKGEYIRTWVEKLRNVDLESKGSKETSGDKLLGVFQAWRLSDEEKERTGLDEHDWVEKPLVKIEFSVNRRGGGAKRGRGRGKGRGFERKGLLEKV
ncbi:hypothetical protein AAFC00_001483 [Neodothiora populina]|uniref:Cryptochrome DASH n=1 Tax=Neodothiora populina TaxID=2781224 RepID=A0ABR3PPG0_9PEZI